MLQWWGLTLLHPSRVAAARQAEGESPGPPPPAQSEAFGVLPWDVALRSLPWNVLFLVGGGLALALAYKESNLSHEIATAFTSLRAIPFPLLQLSVCIVTILISNFISNVATANIILPPLGCIAVHLGR
jgi:di/tricarboxylate transporter